MKKKESEREFLKRINFDGNLKNISTNICINYNLGDFISNKIVLVGYEDLNYILKTTKGIFFVKVFAKFRSLKDCKRYVNIMEQAIKKHISTPKLYSSNQGNLHIIKENQKNIRLCLLEYIDGDNIFNLNDSPNKKDIKFIAKQAALINSIKIKPVFTYDSWAIPEFPKEYRKKSKYLSKEDKEIIKPLLLEFKKMNIDSLPKSFVHGDILKTNVIKDKTGKLWIIDFSVSNYYPRIQELAVMACNFLYNKDSKKESEANIKLALEEYEKIITLTKHEKEALRTYIKLAHAMHIIAGSHQKYVLKNKSTENEYWLNQGKSGLRQMLN